MNCLELELLLEQDIIESMIEDLGYDGLAKIVNKLPSFKAFMSAFPLDKWDKIYSLDRILEDGQTVPDHNERPDELVIGADIVEQYRASLTPRQNLIINLTMEGYTQPEIAVKLGLDNTQIIRYQKHQAKLKWLKASSTGILPSDFPSPERD